jgi:hypothetical protein
VNRLRIVALLLAALLLVGCEEYTTYTPSAGDLTALAENYDGEDKADVQGTAVSRYLTAEAAVAVREQAQADIAKLQATQAAAEDQERRQYLAMTADAQATRDTLSAQATRQAVEALATAQAQASQATATAQSVALTAQSVAIAATGTAEARYWQATRTAEALDREATATAQYKADVATATQQAKDDRATATTEAIQATAQAYHATMTRQAEKREIVLGYGRDYGIPVVLLLVGVALAGLVWYGIREYKKRPVVYPRNLLGDAEPMAVPVEGGGYNFVDLDRQPGPVLKVLPNGEVSAPLVRSAGQEERTTARDQAVDAATRPRLGAGNRGMQAALPAPQAPAPGLRSVRVLRRLDQAGRAGFLPPALVESLQADWED